MTKNQTIVGTVVVEPENMTKLIAGTYRKTAPAPKFHLAFRPNKPDDIGVLLDSLEGDRDVTFIYHFQNFGDVDCHITVCKAD